jgi:hypothetical protein
MLRYQPWPEDMQGIMKKYEVRECQHCTALIATDKAYGRPANVKDTALCECCTSSAHTFILPPPNGQEAQGVCSQCGEQRIHFNSGNERGDQWKPTTELQRTERKGIA